MYKSYNLHLPNIRLRLPRFVARVHLLGDLVTLPVEGPVGAWGSGEVACDAVRSAGSTDWSTTRGDTGWLAQSCGIKKSLRFILREYFPYSRHRGRREKTPKGALYTGTTPVSNSFFKFGIQTQSLYEGGLKFSKMRANRIYKSRIFSLSRSRALGRGKKESSFYFCSVRTIILHENSPGSNIPECTILTAWLKTLKRVYFV